MLIIYGDVCGDYRERVHYVKIKAKFRTVQYWIYRYLLCCGMLIVDFSIFSTVNTVIGLCLAMNSVDRWRN